jgi:hypothetical protein
MAASRAAHLSAADHHCVIFNQQTEADMAEDSNVERHPPRATEGKTRVGDIYRPSDDHALIGFLAPASRMIYFAEYAMERVKTKFGVHKVTGNVWISTHPIFRGEYTAAAMTTLNLNQTLHAGMATVNEKSECDKFPKGPRTYFCANGQRLRIVPTFGKR